MAEAIKREKNYQVILDKLNGLKREAYAYLDQALNLDAAKQCNEAVIIYRKCSILLKKAIDYIKNENIDLVKCVEANKIHQDLNIMLKKTLDRLALLEKDVTNHVEVVSPPQSNNIDEYLLIGDEILNEESNSSLIEVNVSTSESNATEIYNIESGVQLFYIAPDGSVSTPSYPTSLSVYLFK